MLTHHGDIHHLFPKNFLKQQGLNRNQYNQVANLVYVQQEVNIKIGDKAPQDYLKTVYEQCLNKTAHYGVITEEADLISNLTANCLPVSLEDYQVEAYNEFLEKRRMLMADKIKRYYFDL
jgi:hypothetical protein